MLCLSDVEDDIGAFIKNRVPKAAIRTVFDVGAGYGWFTHEFGKSFPDARFYLFEPSPPILPHLNETLARFPELNYQERARVFPMAVGDQNSVVKVTTLDHTTVNRVVRDDRPDAVAVKMTTGDTICQELAIDHIDYLKIDVEGYDLNVLFGFEQMLSSQKIDFIQVEAGMDLKNEYHTHFDLFRQLLAKHDYHLFRFINQASPPTKPVLSWADVVFISGPAADRFGG